MAFSFCRTFIVCMTIITTITGCAHKLDINSTLPIEEMKEQFKKDTKETASLDMMSLENEKNFDDSAMSVIGSIYQFGQGDVKKDIEKYKRWMLLAADHGNGFALQDMGNNYRYGRHGFDKNPRLAILYYRACTTSWLRSCHLPLGEMYRDGALEYGIRADKNKAFYHLHMAIDTGNDSKKVFRDFYHSLTAEEKRSGMLSTCFMLDVGRLHGDDYEKLCATVLKPKMDIALKDIQDASPPRR